MLGEIKNSHHPHRKKFQTPRPSGELRVTGRLTSKPRPQGGAIVGSKHRKLAENPVVIHVEK